MDLDHIQGTLEERNILISERTSKFSLSNDSLLH